MRRLARRIQAIKALAAVSLLSSAPARPAALASRPSFSQQAGPYSSKKQGRITALASPWATPYRPPREWATPWT